MVKYRLIIDAVPATVLLALNTCQAIDTNKKGLLETQTLRAENSCKKKVGSTQGRAFSSVASPFKCREMALSEWFS